MFYRLILPLIATYLIMLVIQSIAMTTWSALGDPLDLYQTRDTRLSLKNGTLDSKKSRAMVNWGKSAMTMVTFSPTCQRQKKEFFFHDSWKISALTSNSENVTFDAVSIKLLFYSMLSIFTLFCKSIRMSNTFMPLRFDSSTQKGCSVWKLNIIEGVSIQAL